MMMLPAATGRFWARDITLMMLIATASGLLAGYAGLLVSFHFGVASGPAIILIAGVLYLISLLFGLKPPKQFDAATTIQAIWSEYGTVSHDSTLQAQTITRISDRLLKTHGFKFTPEEAEQLTNVFNAFQGYGPDISTRSGTSGRGGGFGGGFGGFGGGGSGGGGGGAGW